MTARPFYLRPWVPLRPWALAVFLASCSTTPPPRDDSQIAERPPRYSLVFLIHGDGDYAYHDTLGQARRADEEMLARAQAVAEQNHDAEVVIFHEIARRHVLFLIPRRDGRAYHYRHGRLLAQKSYWRDQGSSRFDPEVQIYEQFAGKESHPPVRLFLYCGHELSEFDASSPDASSKRRVTVDELVAGVGAIAGDSGKIDLLVLATCFGGTPHTIGALAPYARTIVASPDNLHLSYFDLEPLARLNVGTDDGEVAALADRFAHHAFERLTGEVQTAVSVVVYDTAEVGGYVDAVAGAYDRTLTAASEVSASFEPCDCADDSTFVRPEMGRGLTVHYRAPRFGRMKHKQGHSGWECWHTAE